MTTPTLWDIPPAIAPRDPAVRPEAFARLSAQSLAILARLRQGPATNTELAAISLRFGARLYDIRKAGGGISIVSHDHATGVVTYRLDQDVAAGAKGATA